MTVIVEVANPDCWTAGDPVYFAGGGSGTVVSLDGTTMTVEVDGASGLAGETVSVCHDPLVTGTSPPPDPPPVIEASKYYVIRRESTSDAGCATLWHRYGYVYDVKLGSYINSKGGWDGCGFIALPSIYGSISYISGPFDTLAEGRTSFGSLCPGLKAAAAAEPTTNFPAGWWVYTFIASTTVCGAGDVTSVFHAVANSPALLPANRRGCWNGSSAYIGQSVHASEALANAALVDLGLY